MSTMQATGHSPTPAVVHPHTVLVVEDEPAVRDLVADLLREEGYQVEEAHDGAEAIQRLDAHTRHADHVCGVLLDMMLPRVDGLGVLHHLATVGADFPVVAMSASREHLRAALAAGACTAVAKPFDLDRLLSAMYTSCTCPPTAP